MFFAILLSFAFSVEGFYSIKDSSHPSWVRSHANSIFTIILHEPYSVSTKLSDKDVIDYMQSTCVEPKLVVDKLNCKHFLNCVGDMCNYKPHTDKGTAFLIDNGDVLVTAFHVLYPLHQMQMMSSANIKIKEILDWSPAFLLVDSYGNIIFDSKKEPVFYLNAGAPKLFESAFLLDSPHMLLYDFAKIQLPRKLGAGLKRSSNLGSNLYVMGYPRQVKRRNGFSSNGYDIYVSRGKKVDLVQKTREVASKKLAIGNYVAMKNYPIIATDMDIVPGNSGSPIFNFNGEVIGIVSVSVMGPGFTYMGLNYGIPFSIIDAHDL